MQVLKKTYSKNNNEIILVKNDSLDDVGLASPTYFGTAKTILIIGVVHGDEPQGKFLIENYLNQRNSNPALQSPRSLWQIFLLASLRALQGRVSAKPNEREIFQHEERELGKRVRGNHLLFIPCLNPDGLALGTRENANGVDLNRNFPTKNNPNYSPFTIHHSPHTSEAESQFIIDIIEEFEPGIILTLHAPYKVVNYDGPAGKIAQDISEIINYPTSNDIGYSTPGSLGTYAGIERNIPIITLELDEEIDVNELIAPVTKVFDYLMEV
jgi:murein peptide amidase A